MQNTNFPSAIRLTHWIKYGFVAKELLAYLWGILMVDFKIYLVRNCFLHRSNEKATAMSKTKTRNYCLSYPINQRSIKGSFILLFQKLPDCLIPGRMGLKNDAVVIQAFDIESLGTGDFPRHPIDDILGQQDIVLTQKPIGGA